MLLYYSVKLGYSELVGTDHICSLYPGFVITDFNAVLTGLISVVKLSFGIEYVSYNRLFVIIKF